MQMQKFRSYLAAGTLLAAAVCAPIMAAPGDTPAHLPTVTQEAQDIGVCKAPTSHAGTAKILACTCPAGLSATTSLWGTDVYTADTYICSAAIHASVIDDGGGRVTLQMLPGRSSYTGTKRNGVTTRSYGKYTASYRFVNAPFVDQSQSAASTDTNSGKRKVSLGNPLKRKAAKEVTASVGLGKIGNVATRIIGEDIGECTGATSYRNTGKALSCTCPANFTLQSPVWGQDIYTDDSYICKTALHAGIITRSGGRVSFQMLPGQSSYLGTTRNGVTTLSYGSHAGSYSFNK